MPEPTNTPDEPIVDNPAPDTPDAPEEKQLSQEEVDALVDDTLKEYLPPSIDKPKDDTDKKGDEPDEPEDKEEPEESEEPEDEPEAPEEKKEDKPDDEPDEPDGLFIEVEDADGNKYKITKESDLPEDFMPKNNRQVIEILKQLADLDIKKAEAEKSKEVEAQEQAAEERKQQTLQGWDNEINSLVEHGILDAPKAKPGSKLWESDPAVQKADSVFKFMVEQNKARAEKELPPITSFAEAYLIKQSVESKNAEAEKIKADNKAAKAKSALVGRTSTPSSGEGEAYRAGSARSIDDIEI